MNTPKKIPKRTGYVVRGQMPRTGETPTPPKVGDLMPFGDLSRPTLYRVAKVQPARTGIDDIVDGVTISHHYRLDELYGSREPFIWLEHAANYDTVRVTMSDYFAKWNK
jgi:hypothetical protein